MVIMHSFMCYIKYFDVNGGMSMSLCGCSPVIIVRLLADFSVQSSLYYLLFFVFHCSAPSGLVCCAEYRSVSCHRYYPLFGLMANVALIFSGQYVKYVSGLRSGLPVGECA